MRSFITDTTERIEWFDHARSGVDSVTCDYLYMVSPTPVGCVYFSLGGKSDPNPAGYTIEYATGVDEWQEVSRIIDQTKAFKTSGYLEFSADGDKEPVTLDEAPTGLPAYRDH